MLSNYSGEVKMLVSHMAKLEKSLLTLYDIPAGSKHGGIRGNARESFLREFLEDHLPETLTVGTGEIIDSKSRPDEQRPQCDIVIYKKNYPQLPLGGGAYAYLAESVVATVEVKSTLDNDGLIQSVISANKIKQLQRKIGSGLQSGYIPKNILSFVVSYKSDTTNMETIAKRLMVIEGKEGIAPEYSVDGVFCLGVGTLLNRADCPFGLRLMNQRWAIAPSVDGNLLPFFIWLTQAVCNINASAFDITPYVR